MTHDDFIQSKIAFIHEFMNSTRPASELEDFIKAYDTLCPCQITISAPEKMEKEVVSSTFEPVETEKPIVKRGRKKAERMVIHNENTTGVHPRAKMVKVSFFDRDNYYGSVKAAAHALGVSQSTVSKAIKYRNLVNGHDVEFVNASELMTAPKTE